MHACKEIPIKHMEMVSCTYIYMYLYYASRFSITSIQPRIQQGHENFSHRNYNYRKVTLVYV